MGHPRRQRKKYSTPSHPWQKDRIEEEKGLIREYGLKNKKEIWKMNSILKKLSKEAKKLITLSVAQAETEKKHMIDKLKSIGVVKETGNVDDVLGITLKDIMERRLQTIVLRKNLARTIKQARQFIVHSHIAIGDKVVTSPAYIVRTTEEPSITFLTTSSLSNADHPEREVKIKAQEEKTEEIKKEPKKEAKTESKKAAKKDKAKNQRRKQRKNRNKEQK